MNNELIKEKSWWSRNWKWVVPTGGCLTLIVLVLFAFGALIFGVASALEDSAPYANAMEQLQQNETAKEVLGEPIESHGMPQGSLNFSNGDGDVDFRIPVKGPKTKGILFVIGEKRNDEWTYSKLFVEINETEDQINLLDEVTSLPEVEE